MFQRLLMPPSRADVPGYITQTHIHTYTYRVKHHHVHTQQTAASHITSVSDDGGRSPKKTSNAFSHPNSLKFLMTEYIKHTTC
jgi:hypothetical protein